MTTTRDVVIFKVRIVKNATRRPYNVRWRTGEKTKPHSEYFTTEGLANGFIDTLKFYMGKGVEFDMETGLPMPVLEERRAEEREKAEESALASRVTALQHFKDFAAYKWPKRSGKYRTAIADTLRDFMVALLPAPPTWVAPKALSLALRNWAFDPTMDLNDADDETIDILGWVEENSPILEVLEDLEVLSELLDKLTMKYKDRTYTTRVRASAKHFEKRKTILSGVLRYGVVKDRLLNNPLTNPKLDWERPSGFHGVNTVSPHEIGDLEQVASMLAAVSYVWPSGLRYSAAFGCMYFGLMRPEEVADLHEDQCVFPTQMPKVVGYPELTTVDWEAPWGELYLKGALPYVGSKWTDDGKTHEQRSLKHRAINETRTGPMPPPLALLLRWHIQKFGVAPNGRLFVTPTGKPLSPSTLWLLWNLARRFGLGPREQARGVLRTVYRLRTSGICFYLAAGVSDEQVSEWAGNTVAVLHQYYARAIRTLKKTWQTKVARFIKRQEN